MVLLETSTLVGIAGAARILFGLSGLTAIDGLTRPIVSDNSANVLFLVNRNQSSKESFVTAEVGAGTLPKKAVASGSIVPRREVAMLNLKAPEN